MRLEGKVALITGGASGIGRGITLCLADDGADIVVVDLDLKKSAEVVAEVEKLGRKALALEADVSKGDEVEKMAKKALSTFEHIDILVNNAGVVGSWAGRPFTRLSEKDWDSCYEVNLKGIFLVCKALAPHMQERKSGKIINIASIAGKIGGDMIPHYSASKAGAINITQSLAIELARDNINVNAICPGLLWTPMWEKIAVNIMQDNPAYEGKTPREVFDLVLKRLTPLKREQTPRDIGKLASFLASEDARNITGQAINLDGGAVMH